MERKIREGTELNWKSEIERDENRQNREKTEILNKVVSEEDGERLRERKIKM